MDSIDTENTSGDEEDLSDMEYEFERIRAKKSLSWDASVGLTPKGNRQVQNSVTHEAKLFLLKLLMIPATAYAFTFALWLYQTHFTSSIVIYKVGKNQKIVGEMYAPVSVS